MLVFRYEYRWADGVQIKKPIEVSAPKYVEYLMDWIEGQLDDESIFPQRLGNSLSFVTGFIILHINLFIFLFLHLPLLNHSFVLIVT